jgi:hypothetical protein
MVEIAIGIVGLWVAYATYKKSFPSTPPEPVEEKANFLANYRMTQQLSLEVQGLVQQYIDKGYGDREMYVNITFQQFLDVAKEEFDKCLSNKLYTELEAMQMTKSNIESMLKMIETQNMSLTELRNQMIFLNRAG